MRILGLDYGAKTVGVAVSDALGITAQALETVTRERETKLRRTVARIAELCEQYEIGKIVLGLPLLMSDEIGDRAQKAMEFGEMLKKRTGLEVIMWDERLTTVAADEVLDEMGVRGRYNRKAVIDQIAAGFILQEYLDAQSAKEQRI
ncbi:MAG: Holliday junction resolvase RuvX [Eubacterium sp.]|nr:Holliday junction resolvase RuvX [Eubacterium sp.]